MKQEKSRQRTVRRRWRDKMGETLEFFYLWIMFRAERIWGKTVSGIGRSCQDMILQIRRCFANECYQIRRSCRRRFFRFRFAVRKLIRSKATSVQRIALQSVVLAVLFLVLTGLIFGIAHRVSAREQRYAKYVTCITIEDGDSLWQIAERYLTDGYADIPSFIEDIRTCNNLFGDEIHAGEKLIVPYFVPLP